ncbi:tetratricopeptide repeat protein [Chelativorans sp. M5D2P16]|uniref:tetratricopeptide repeat protein n=1 Tax=Chelativorans sp. M5D2P16 TaxID=3095678 RepID=UPI002ACAB41C|nr:tetratricopeptide repeat protein [Chelativorans sp. M5D2P16]MDZ5699000.1 tetratricopeptide repeat protein [Chelativorans sp. M5D2P16]
MAHAERLRLAGRLVEAEAHCRQILAARRDDAEALHLLGLIAYQSGRRDEALDHLKRAVALAPKVASYHANLGELYRLAGHIEEAIAAARRAVRLKADHPEGHSNLGAALFDAGKYEEAAECHRRAIALKPDFALAHANLASALHSLGRFEEATESRRRAAALDPRYATATASAAGTAPAQRHTPAQALALAGQHARAGRLDEAEALCRRVLAAAPQRADAEHFLGILAYRRGRLDAAIAHLRHAIERDDSAVIHADLGEMYRLSGNPQEATAEARRALALRPDYPAALNNLGVALYELERYGEALTCYDRAIALDPDFADAHSNRGNALRALGRLQEAETALRRALQLKPRFASAWNNLGTALREMERPEEAEDAYRNALKEASDDPGTLDNLALLLKDLDRLDESFELLRRACAIAPRNPKLHIHAASLSIRQRKFDTAAETVERAIALAPDDPEALELKARVTFEQGDPHAALAHARRALTIDPKTSGAWNTIGNALKQLGQFSEALEAFDEVRALKPESAGVFVNLADCKKFTADDPHLAAMEAAASKADLPITERMPLDFALGKAYSDLKDHDRAFEHLLKGNAAKREQIDYDEAATFALFDRIERTFTPDLMEAKRGAGDPSRLPIFILGMPRSGTSLVEQILASHPAVHGAGELKILDHLAQEVRAGNGAPIAYPEFVTAFKGEEFRQLGARYVEQLGKLAGDAPRVTDKMPANFFFAGLIHLALPNAVIIHTVRDPVDTCVSCFSKLFSDELNYSYHLGELGRFYRRYQGLMAHWYEVLPPGRILDVRYEELVDDLEVQARRLLAHCDLDWNPRCLAFHKTARPVRTASATQVRRPIYGSSVGRWRAYEQYLMPLLTALKPAEPSGSHTD